MKSYVQTKEKTAAQGQITQQEWSTVRWYANFIEQNLPFRSGRWQQPDHLQAADRVPPLTRRGNVVSTPVLWRTVSNTPALYPLDARSTTPISILQTAATKCVHTAKCSQGPQLLLVENHWSCGSYLMVVGLTIFTVTSLKKKKKSESESCSVLSDSLRPHGLYSPWNSPGQNTGVGSHFLL